jgi:hypothetical protein
MQYSGITSPVVAETRARRDAVLLAMWRNYQRGTTQWQSRQGWEAEGGQVLREMEMIVSNVQDFVYLMYHEG